MSGCASQLSRARPLVYRLQESRDLACPLVAVKSSSPRCDPSVLILGLTRARENLSTWSVLGSSSDHPEELIEEAETRARMSTFQHSELLAEHEILQNKIPAATEDTNQGWDPEKKQAEHGTDLHQINDWKSCCKLLILRSARHLARQSGKKWRSGTTAPEKMHAAFQELNAALDAFREAHKKT
jgi:hypothetical protein